MRAKRSVLLALTDTHHGFFKGTARYAWEHHWHVVADMIYTAKIPVGWRGDGILSFIGDRDDPAAFILASGLPAVEISMVRNDIKMKRSLHEEVVRLRMAQVKKLLTTTRLKVVEVAERTGFSRPSHLFRTFRKLVGMSPKIWRNRQAADRGAQVKPARGTRYRSAPPLDLP